MDILFSVSANLMTISMRRQISRMHWLIDDETFLTSGAKLTTAWAARPILVVPLFRRLRGLQQRALGAIRNLSNGLQLELAIREAIEPPASIC